MFLIFKKFANKKLNHESEVNASSQYAIIWNEILLTETKIPKQTTLASLINDVGLINYYLYHFIGILFVNFTFYLLNFN